jgi:predicted HTH transcriptional regulator
MSGDEELDKLLFSIPKSSKKKKQADSKENPPVDEPEQAAEKSAEADQDSGFDPLDVVELTDKQRKTVTWLSRHPRSSFQDIQEALEIPAEDLHGLLAELLEEKRIRSVERDGKILYSAPIRGRASRRLRGFPKELWKKAGLDDD